MKYVHVMLSLTLIELASNTANVSHFIGVLTFFFAQPLLLLCCYWVDWTDLDLIDLNSSIYNISCIELIESALIAHENALATTCDQLWTDEMSSFNKNPLDAALDIWHH